MNKLRDKMKDKEYWKSKYEYRLNHYKEKILKIDKYLLQGFKEETLTFSYYNMFITGFKVFYTGYSLGMDIEELKPIGEEMIYGAYKRFKWESMCFNDIRKVLIFAIILNIRNEYITKYIKKLREYKVQDRYLDHLINYIDETEEIKAKDVLWKKSEKTVMQIVDLAEEGKKEEAVKLLKKYVSKEWINLQDGGTILAKGTHLEDCYVGYWCIEAAALVKMYGLDDTILKECDYYPEELAHFEG